MSPDWTIICKAIAESNGIELEDVTITGVSYDPATKKLDFKVTIQPPPIIVVEFTIPNENTHTIFDLYSLAGHEEGLCAALIFQHGEKEGMRLMQKHLEIDLQRMTDAGLKKRILWQMGEMQYNAEVKRLRKVLRLEEAPI